MRQEELKRRKSFIIKKLNGDASEDDDDGENIDQSSEN